MTTRSCPYRGLGLPRGTRANSCQLAVERVDGKLSLKLGSTDRHGGRVDDAANSRLWRVWLEVMVEVTGIRQEACDSMPSLCQIQQQQGSSASAALDTFLSSSKGLQLNTYYQELGIQVRLHQQVRGTSSRGHKI